MAGLASMFGLGGGGAPSPEALQQMAEKMPGGGGLPPTMPGLGKGKPSGLPPNFPGGLPGLPRGLPGLGGSKKK